MISCHESAAGKPARAFVASPVARRGTKASSPYRDPFHDRDPSHPSSSNRSTSLSMIR